MPKAMGSEFRKVIFFNKISCPIGNAVRIHGGTVILDELPVIINSCFSAISICNFNLLVPSVSHVSLRLKQSLLHILRKC